MAMYGLPMGTNYGGFLSDSARVPFADAMLVPVPDGDRAGRDREHLRQHPRRLAHRRPAARGAPGAPVLICASGATIALYATSIALALGAERVDFAGGNSYLRERAEELGANLLDKEFPKRPVRTRSRSMPAATPTGLACALRSTEPEGICTSIGIYFTETTPVPLLEMFTKGIRFHTGRAHARPAMEPLLDLVRAGRFKPELVTGETAEWDDAPEAIAGHRSKLVISREAA